jgi:multiple sugar transport system ATP-binding protein
MASVELSGVAKRYDGVLAVDDVSLDIADGELFVLLGPSGCGKSTLLKLIGGLEDPTEGEIRIGGAIVNHVSPGRRDVAMVFQSYALYPHMTARENVRFPLRMAKVPRGEAARAVEEAAGVLGLEALLDRKVGALSGGERQRVAVARALVNRPLLVLADEPTGNLDSRATGDLLRLFAELRQARQALLVVTHDARVASTADRLLRMRDGAIVAQTRLGPGTPAAGVLASLAELGDG